MSATLAEAVVCLSRPSAASEAIRKTMRSTKNKGTGPELALRKALWAAGFRGYRANLSRLPGTPDVAFTKKRIAILVHGCFWHGCSKCSNFRPPKANADFWAQKLSETRDRDRRAQLALEQLGYIVLVVWECEIERELPRVIETVSSMLHSTGGA